MICPRFDVDFVPCSPTLMDASSRGQGFPLLQKLMNKVISQYRKDWKLSTPV